MYGRADTLKLDCLIYHLVKSICVDQQCLPLTQASKERKKKKKNLLNPNSIVLIPPEALKKNHTTHQSSLSRAVGAQFTGLRSIFWFWFCCEKEAAEKAKRKFVVFYFPLWMLRTMADGVKLHEIHQGLNLNRLRESLKRFFHVAKLQIGANKYLLLKR